MALDMYLHRKFYVKNWNHQGENEKHSFTITKGGKPSSIPTEKICYITTEEIYWRKANAIHNWFVINIQNGENDCGHYMVPKSKMQELLSIINKILKNHSKAKELLPTKDDFVFGSTKYDDRYFSYLEDTQKVFAVLLLANNKENEGEFYYTSSW